MNAVKCQMQDKNTIHEGKPQPVLLSRRTRFVMMLSSPLNPRTKRLIKNYLKQFTTWKAGESHSIKALTKAELKLADISLKTGDLVRVLSIDEIRVTLNSDNRLKGLKFLPEMEQYCGTTQRVFKPVERFLNECDYTVRKARGLVLLENVFCEGIAGAGRCDRSCFYFWRVEWLEYLDQRE